MYGKINIEKQIHDLLENIPWDMVSQRLHEEMQSISQDEKDHQTTLKRISSLEKMLRSPYFARIDLQFEEDEEDV